MGQCSRACPYSLAIFNVFGGLRLLWSRSAAVFAAWVDCTLEATVSKTVTEKKLLEGLDHLF